MQPEQRLARAVTRIFNNTTSTSVCTSCQRTLRRRQYASAAAAAAAVQTRTQEESAAPPEIRSTGYKSQSTAVSALRPAYQMKAGVVLSRPPQITRDLHPFEKAFYFYQRRLNERLALPFTRYFYYKKGTPADAEWKRKMRDRLTPARDIGVYNAYSKTGWNDEVLVGAQESEPQNQVDALLKDAELPAAGETTAEGKAEAGVKAREEVERPAARASEADQQGDMKSLNRLLQRTLFLLVKGKDGRWSFPSATLLKNENFHTAAERVIVESAGANMNTWIVGNHPVGHYRFDFPKAIENKENSTSELGEKVWFMKARIMAGQANLAANTLGNEDFRWMCKEEIQQAVTPKYWSMCQDMLGDR